MAELKANYESNKNNVNINGNENEKEKEKIKLTGYPDKFTKLYDQNKNSTIFSWNLNAIGENDYQKISIEMPLFNKKCRKLVNNIYLFIINLFNFYY